MTREKAKEKATECVEGALVAARCRSRGSEPPQHIRSFFLCFFCGHPRLRSFSLSRRANTEGHLPSRVRAHHERLRLSLTIHRQPRGERSRQCNRGRCSAAATKPSASAAKRIPVDAMHPGLAAEWLRRLTPQCRRVWNSTTTTSAAASSCAWWGRVRRECRQHGAG